MPNISAVSIGDSLPQRSFKPSNVSLFMYNAAIWNPHRIHYDERYAMEVEGYPGVVIDGPLQGDWLAQTVAEWLGEEGELLEFAFTNRQAAYLGEELYCGGDVSAKNLAAKTVTLTLFVNNADGITITPGSAVVRLV